jgi:hypothetical protein
MTKLDTQVAGDHYRRYAIQPIDYIVKNGVGFLAGNVIKYVTRYKDKGGAEDIRKAIHYLELILEFEYAGVELTEIGALTPTELGPRAGLVDQSKLPPCDCPAPPKWKLHNGAWYPSEYL